LNISTKQICTIVYCTTCFWRENSSVLQIQSSNGMSLKCKTFLGVERSIQAL
jgi:hypothetical protein